MASVRFRVSPQLIRIKKYTFGLDSIIYNQKNIYDILWDSLDCEEAWVITQAMIKDTKTKSFHLWMEQGLEKLVYQGLD